MIVGELCLRHFVAGCRSVTCPGAGPAVKHPNARGGNASMAEFVGLPLGVQPDNERLCTLTVRTSSSSLERLSYSGGADAGDPFRGRPEARSGVWIVLPV
jgi:hypothetical protein